MVSGVGYGGLAFAKGIFFGITGLVTEPYKGARKTGPKGFAAGIGKGLIGVVAKPVAGTVGLVGHTIEGTLSTPGTIKKAMTKKGGIGAAAAGHGENEGSDGEEEKKSEEDDDEELLEVAPVEEESKAMFDEDDGMSMRTESLLNDDIEDYNMEKTQMHD